MERDWSGLFPAKFNPDHISNIMNGTATKTIRERLQEQIAECRREAEAIKNSTGDEMDVELAFTLLDRADELERQLETEGGVIQ